MDCCVHHGMEGAHPTSYRKDKIKRSWNNELIEIFTVGYFGFVNASYLMHEKYGFVLNIINGHHAHQGSEWFPTTTSRAWRSDGRCEEMWSDFASFLKQRIPEKIADQPGITHDSLSQENRQFKKRGAASDGKSCAVFQSVTLKTCLNCNRLPYFYFIDAHFFCQYFILIMRSH